MKFSTAFKVFELNVLRQTGVNVTPQQLGLKSDPIADLQAKNASGTFGNVLNQLGNGINTGGLGLIKPPVPPTPPADVTDTAAQTKYQNDLLAYQNSFQVYNQRFLQLFLNQFQSLQQSIATMSQQKSGSSDTSTASEKPIGIGGILSSTDL